MGGPVAVNTGEADIQGVLGARAQLKSGVHPHSISGPAEGAGLGDGQHTPRWPSTPWTLLLHLCSVFNSENFQTQKSRKGSKTDN